MALSDRAMVLSKGKIEKVIPLNGKKPRNIDAPEFRELLRGTEALIKPTPKLDIFVKDLKQIDKKKK